jgi:membrane-bound lytic murein transglycosylase D
MSSNQTAPVTHSTPPPVVPLNTQTPAPEFLTPKWELAVPDRAEIDTWVRRFSEEKHRSFQTQLDRARFYVVPVQQIFEERGLPKDIVFVALVESGFTPTAKSHASAVGMWQFISATGKRFGLEQNEWVDERRHPFKSARAAADYLSFLYDMFGSWPLALAAYNCGENAVQGAQVKSGLKSFWELAEAGYLPSETRDYVPKLLATVKIIRNPQQYAFRFDPKHYVQRHETVSVPGGVKLAALEKKAGVPKASLQDCNPELCKPETPPWCSSYELCVPVGTGGMIMSAISQGGLKEEKPPVKEPAPKTREKASPPSPATLSCKVNPGETWFGLSRKYGCTPQELALLNGTRLSSPLKAGQTVKVPCSERLASPAAVQKKPDAGRKVELAQSSGKKAVLAVQKPPTLIHYPIREGDTLWSIAGRFNVSVDVLCAKNELKPNQKLIPGKLLTIHGSNKQETARRGK